MEKAENVIAFPRATRSKGGPGPDPLSMGSATAAFIVLLLSASIAH